MFTTFLCQLHDLFPQIVRKLNHTIVDILRFDCADMQHVSLMKNYGNIGCQYPGSIHILIVSLSVPYH